MNRMPLVHGLHLVNKLLLLKNKLHSKVYDTRDSGTPTFLIGAPRSGSTAIYQAITSALEVGYINNLSCALHNSLALGFKASILLYGKKGHQCFTSRFGNTLHCGLNAPSECGQFWYRWLPKEKHFIDWEDISPKMIKEIRSEISRATKIVGNPIVFKNLNAGQRLRLISRIAPEAKIIHVHRKPEYIIQSILLARRKNNIPDGMWWSIKPPNYTEYLSFSKIDICTAQVKALEAQIKVDRKLFPTSNWIDIGYQEFIHDPVKEVKNIGRFIGAELRSLERLNLIENRIDKGRAQKIVVSEAEWSKILESVNDRNIEVKIAENTKKV